MHLCPYRKKALGQLSLVGHTHFENTNGLCKVSTPNIMFTIVDTAFGLMGYVKINIFLSEDLTDKITLCWSEVVFK